VREQLERVLASRYFLDAEGRGRFLRFVVEQALADRAAGLKEYVIGVEVFGRGEAFDPKADSIVRVEARKLRAKLEEYYQNEGRADHLRIEIPKGGPTLSYGDCRTGSDVVLCAPGRQSDCAVQKGLGV
jgi:hypothetical protein